MHYPLMNEAEGDFNQGYLNSSNFDNNFHGLDF